MIVETDNTGTTLATYTYDPSGALFSMTRGGATYFYHLNARGDVVALTDSSGAVVNTYTYDPWGAPLTASETVENPYRYASYRYDTSTGLYYCWNRYYAPEFARFLTRDIYPGELSDPVTMNPYLYCGGDPVNAVDPSGTIALVDDAFGIALVAVVLVYAATVAAQNADQLAIAGQQALDGIEEAGRCAAGWVAAQNTKHRIKRTEGNLRNAETHLTKLMMSPNGNDRNKWIVEITAALSQAQKALERVPDATAAPYVARIAEVQAQLNTIVVGGQ